MLKDTKEDIVAIKLCTSCFNCKKKGKRIYCKLGVWEEKDIGKTILHAPYDFNCNRWEEA